MQPGPSTFARSCFSFGLFTCLVPEVRLRRAVCQARIAVRGQGGFARRNEKAGRALLLKEIYGYDVPEIARLMDTTERNVYYFTREGKRVAREEWKRKEDG